MCTYHKSYNKDEYVIFLLYFPQQKKTQLKIISPDVKNSHLRESCASKAFGESCFFFFFAGRVESPPTHPYLKTDHNI